MNMSTDDYVARNKVRTLAVILDDEELLQIARAKSKREIRVRKMQEDMAVEVRRRKAEIEAEQAAVNRMTEELDTGRQMREVKTEEIWVNGQVHAVRLDTGETFERRPPTAAEQQRRIPGSDAVPPTVRPHRPVSAADTLPIVPRESKLEAAIDNVKDKAAKKGKGK